MKAIFRLVLRTEVTRGRAVALGTVGVIGLLLALAVSRVSDFDRPVAAFRFVQGYGLSLLVPVTALVFSAAALGDPAEDGTLVYLWHRPLARWRLALAAFLAAACITIPFAVVPTVAAAALAGGSGGLVRGALLASALASIGYCGVFLTLGLLVRRALTWGLAYVLIWEGFVARSGTGAARLSILLYARSVLAHETGGHGFRLAASMPVAVVVPLVVGFAAVGATTWALRRIDVR
jgi:ABC-2 type transport system permease protein